MTSARRQLDRKAAELEPSYQAMVPSWSDVASLTRPTRPRFLPDSQRRDRRNSRILIPAARYAGNISSAGLQHGTASPARPWINLGVDELEPSPAVTEWLQDLTKAQLTVYERSNLYEQMAMSGRDAMDFGTGLMASWDDEDDISRFQTFPIGSYRLGNDRRGMVAVFHRTWQLPLGEVIERWGEDNLSDYARSEARGHRWLTKIAINHLIMPEGYWPEFEDQYGALDHFPFREAYWEGPARPESRRDAAPFRGRGSMHLGDGVLAWGGYHEFPIMADRWDRDFEDEYGASSPGLDTAGLNACLQMMERMGLAAVEKMNDPSVVVGPGFKNSPVSTLARAIMVDSEATGRDSTARPLFDVKTPVQHLHAREQWYAQMIRELYSVDVFLMFAGDDRSEARTARETGAKLAEKSSMLAPILQRRFDNFISPAVQRTTAQLFRRADEWWRQGRDAPFLRKPPPELQGRRIRVQFTSEIAEALKLAGLDPIERHLAYRLEIGQVVPAFLDGVRAKADDIVREHGRLSGVPERLLATEEEVAAVRQADAEAAARERKVAETEAAAAAMKNMAAAKVGDGNALEHVVGA